MAQTENVLSDFMRTNADQLWQKLKSTFDDDVAFIRSVRLEGRDEAVDKSSPTEFDEEIGLTIKHPLLVPYRRTNDIDELKQYLQYARHAIPELINLFERGVANPHFLQCWGAFQYACGFVDACYFACGDDLGPIRAGESGSRAVSKARQHKWVSHLLLRQMRSGRDRQRAERDVAKAIKDFIEGGLPAGYDKGWFDVLNSDGQLKSTYTRKHLSKRCMEALAREPKDDIPDTEIPIPKT